MNQKTTDAIKYLNAHYEYETEHVDAAAGYDVILDDFAESTYGIIAHPFADAITFTTKLPPECADYSGNVAHWIENDTLYISLFLGQQEMEAEIDAEFTSEEIDWIESNSEWTHVHGYWYTMYPDNLSVIATYSVE